MNVFLRKVCVETLNLQGNGILIFLDRSKVLHVSDKRVNIGPALIELPGQRGHLNHTIPKLMATCWTTAGAASPAGPIFESPFTLEQRVSAAAADGWSGFGLVYADLMAFQKNGSLADLRRMLDDNGIEQLELELIENWWADDGRTETGTRVRQDIFTAAEALGAKTVKVGPDLDGPLASKDQLASAFDQLALEAHQHGTRVALEFLPWAQTLNTLDAGIEFVTDVANPSGGLCVDIWHVARAHTDYDVIADSLPAEYLFAVELNDAADEMVGTFFEDTVQRRLLPGDGAFDVPAFINAVRSAGFDGMWGVEILSDRHRDLPLSDALRESRESTFACFAEADRRQTR